MKIPWNYCHFKSGIKLAFSSTHVTNSCSIKTFKVCIQNIGKRLAMLKRKSKYLLFELLLMLSIFLLAALSWVLR